MYCYQRYIFLYLCFLNSAVILWDVEHYHTNVIDLFWFCVRAYVLYRKVYSVASIFIRYLFYDILKSFFYYKVLFVTFYLWDSGILFMSYHQPSILTAYVATHTCARVFMCGRCTWNKWHEIYLVAVWHMMFWFCCFDSPRVAVRGGWLYTLGQRNKNKSRLVLREQDQLHVSFVYNRMLSKFSHVIFKHFIYPGPFKLPVSTNKRINEKDR